MDSDELRTMLEQGAKGPLVTLLVAIDEARAHHIPPQVIQFMLEENPELSRGLLLVAAIWAAATLQSFCLQQYFHRQP